MQISICRKIKDTGKFVAQNENRCQLNFVFVPLSHFCVLLSALSHVRQFASLMPSNVY